MFLLLCLGALFGCFLVAVLFVVLGLCLGTLSLCVVLGLGFVCVFSRRCLFLVCGLWLVVQRTLRRQRKSN